jgi:DNA-binding IclR family transcriptional regulator
MTRPSPQTERIRQIIDLLSNNPRESFQLSQIARHLGISKAGCYPTLNALTQAGWLIRHPTSKSYRLGPALIAIGKAAEHFNPTRYALPALQYLVEESGCSCLALVPSLGGVVISEIVNPSGASNDWIGLKRGHYTKVNAPIGPALMLEAEDSQINEWLYNSSIRNYEEARELFLPAIQASRIRGYTVELRLPMHETYLLAQRLMSTHLDELKDLLHSTARLAVDQLRTHEYLVADIDDKKLYQPIAINAPVYGAAREVEMLLAITDFPKPIPGSEVKRLGEIVRATADNITRDFSRSYYMVMSEGEATS